MKTRHQIANNELLFLFKTQPLDSSQPSILLGLSKPKETTTCMYTNVSSKPWGTFTWRLELERCRCSRHIVSAVVVCHRMQKEYLQITKNLFPYVLWKTVRRDEL
jgi:hypothetical protein